MCIGVIFDTVSIQKYIFSTNNLKENVGASFLVEEKIYKDFLQCAIKEVFGKADESLLDGWEKEPDKIAVKNGALYEIGYVGGGNAFLLFKEEDKARKFIEEWSRNLLVQCPGLIPSAAIGKVELDSNFSSSLKALFKKLAENKAEFVARTIIPRHGITADCPRTGYSREIWGDKLPHDDMDYISSVAYAKLVVAEEASEKYRKILKQIPDSSNYDITNELEKLGQQKHKENYIAIVHIDGNEMSKRFQEMKTLPDLRRLSLSVRHATEKSFKGMLERLIEKIPEMKLSLKRENNKTILPIRPIVLGGDDITFVSEGRLGIWLAKIFIEEFEKQPVYDRLPLTACAGVAITKTKYPFYRGYRLAEELTQNAKNKRKQARGNGSWIDFQLFYGGISGSLEEIRERQYKPFNYDLLMRPYKIEDFNELLKGVRELKQKDSKGRAKFPRSKIMKLREVLYLGREAQELFLVELKSRGLKLPSYKSFDGSKLLINDKTPYLDMIELMELYPDFALNGGDQ